MQRFLESASSEDVFAGTKLLVSGFLHAMQARSIHFKYGMHPVMRELAKRGSAGQIRNYWVVEEIFCPVSAMTKKWVGVIEES